MRIFRYLKQNVGTVVLIVLLLIVQAYCDLSLPSYTSDIVDVGIQQGGVDSAVPIEIGADTLSDLELFMTEDQIEKVAAAFEQGDTGHYVLKETHKEKLDELNEIFGVPMVIVSQMRASDQNALVQIQGGAGQR